MATPFFELNKILKAEADEITAARDRAFIIHHTTDIDAAGDEIEQKVRDIIRRKLPLEYYVSHGHVVDENLNYNGQHDVVIADNSGSPILFKSENGTEYFPYESLFAIGEIKSTYTFSKKYVEGFIKRTQNLYGGLSRAATPPNQITKDINFNFGNGLTFTPGHDRSYRNPVFKFMFFVDKGDFDLEKLVLVYKANTDKDLPNVICILNLGILVKAKMLPDNTLGPVELWPEFIPLDQASSFKWVLIEFGDQETDSNAGALAFLLFALNDHLRNCIVTRPNLMKYFQKLFVSKSIKVIN